MISRHAKYDGQLNRGLDAKPAGADRGAVYFARLAQHLIIEFVPKSDVKLEFLLAMREDIFPACRPPSRRYSRSRSALWKFLP